MVRILLRSAALLILVIIAALGWCYWQVTTLTPKQITEDVFVIQGLGGNVSVLRTGAGAVIVDSMTFVSQGKRIRNLVQELTGEDVAVIINTHYHLDHTHGNPAFPQGTRVLSTERTLEHLKEKDAAFWDGSAAMLLPNETFTERRVLRLGNKTIELIHPGHGHTDGDLVVTFVEDKVISLGDLHFNKHWPNIDLEAGGSLPEWIETLDRVLKLPFDTVIPGHGDISDRGGVQQYQRFLKELWALAQEAAVEGWSLEHTQRQAALSEAADYEDIVFFVIFRLDQDFAVRRAWEEATGNY